MLKVPTSTDVANFANFQQNNHVFMQKNIAYKKYLRAKFIFWQLMANSADFWINNCALKNVNCLKKLYFDN